MLRYIRAKHGNTEQGRLWYGLVLWSEHLRRSITFYGEHDETIAGARREVRYAVHKLINDRAK